jgi:hypothetical protein
VAPVAEAPVTLRPWLRAVGAVAGLKIVLGLLGMIVGGGLPDTQPGRDLIYLAHVLAFTVAAAGLALGGRNDRRAGHLALFFLLIASEFADRLLLRLGVPFPGLANPLLLLGHLQVEALLPYVLWLFVQDFPRVESGGWSTRVPATAVRLSLLTAGVLAALNLIHANALLGGRPASGPIDVAAEFSRYQLGTLYHAVLFALMLPALGFLVRNRRLATADERRRVGLLLAGLVAGAAPMLLIVIVMSFWPAADALLSQPRVFHRLELLVYAGTLSIPATTAYAVLVRHALDVRLVVRKAVGYALARYTILAVALAPLAGLVLLLFAHRDQPLGRMLTGPVGGLLLLAATAGLAMLALRRRLLAAVDRRFFREEYDAAQTLHALAEGSRAARDVTELEEVLVREIDRALHVESGALLVRAPDADVLASPSRRSRPLATMSTLAKALDELSGPLLVTAPAASPVVEGLPLEDRQWLSDGGFRLLLPMIGTQGLLGLLALGGKRSELPYSREDRLLLATVALSARATLETQILSAPGGESAVDSDRPAAECATCGTLAPPGAGECPRCPGRMQTSKVPLTLRDKFRLEARVGRGGMGVVYRATDLHLGRLVAVKTLPWVAPYLATRLRREARAMAAVAHPNLAMIYGVEFFHGVPMLVVEYLAGGTLADRLRRGPLAWPDALALGVTLAEVVDRMHGAGILHRDIKPSNVGFTAEGVPKLLDFGLARAIEAVRELDRTEPPANALPAGSLDSGDATADDLTGAGAVAGTVAYLSPEAIKGDPPDPSFDLWGVSVVLFEAIAGVHPAKVGPPDMPRISALVAEAVPDIRTLAPDCPADVAAFFRELLHADPQRRPATGRALARRLRALLEAHLATAGAAPAGVSTRTE